MENNEIKNVTEETIEVDVVKKPTLLEKAGTVAKKHGKKIIVAGAAVVTVGALVAKALLNKKADNYEPECDEVDEDAFEEEVEDTIE